MYCLGYNFYLMFKIQMMKNSSQTKADNDLNQYGTNSSKLIIPMNENSDFEIFTSEKGLISLLISNKNLQ